MRFSSIAQAGRSLAVAALIVGAATACEDPFSPYWDRGTYHLEYANNRRVPAVVSEGPASYVEVRGGTLTLRSDHSYQLVVQIREQSGSSVYEYSRVFAGPYESEYRTLYLTYFDDDDRYGQSMVANWRDGKIEIVVPDVDGPYGVLCRFDD
jgi:hypothetical protein